MNSTKSVTNVLKPEEKIANAVSAPATVVSSSTHCQRLIIGKIACSVSPEEYRSIELIANSWAMMKIRYGQTNQPANACVRPDTAPPSLAATAGIGNSAAPSRDTSLAGMQP